MDNTLRMVIDSPFSPALSWQLWVIEGNYIFQVRELVLESLEDGEVGGGIAGEMKREGFSHEEV